MRLGETLECLAVTASCERKQLDIGHGGQTTRYRPGSPEGDRSWFANPPPCSRTPALT
jgi:hypothetical protein